MFAAIASAAVLLLTTTAVTAFAPAPLSLARHRLSRPPAAALRATVQDSAVRPKVDAPWVSPGTLWDCLRHGETFNGAMKLIRDRHGDIVRMYIPVFFGEVYLCMGMRANKAVFSEWDAALCGGTMNRVLSKMGAIDKSEENISDALSGNPALKSSIAQFFNSKRALEKNLNKYTETAQKESAALLQSGMDEGKDFDAFDDMWRYIVAVNMVVLFGPIAGEEITELVRELFTVIGSNGLLTPKLRTKAKEIGAFLESNYDDRIARPEVYAGEDSLFAEYFKVLVERKVDLNGKREDFVADLVLLIIAATGNDLIAARWLFSYIYQDPHILQKVREECDALDDPSDADQMLTQMPYMQACITETVRMHSTIPSKLTFRNTPVPLTFRGEEDGEPDLNIPADAKLWLYPNAVHTDPCVFANPEEFCPQRFTDRDEYNRMRRDREVTVFGHGAKACTGEKHARVQMGALVYAFVTTVDATFKSVERGDPVPKDDEPPFFFGPATETHLVDVRPRGS